MASGEPSRLSCLLCETTYLRADGLRRHFLANHRLVWRAGEVVTADDAEIDGRLEALRRRQMSSRRRRRVRAEGRSVAEAHVESSSCRVAVIRGDSSTPADVDWDDADVFSGWSPRPRGAVATASRGCRAYWEDGCSGGLRGGGEPDGRGPATVARDHDLQSGFALADRIGSPCRGRPGSIQA
jgi:hypothetical protein